jgi:hypothetical protein
MGNGNAKLVIDKEFFSMQLYAENNYKDNAYDSYLNVKGMIESFYEQSVISGWAYKSYKKKLKKYEEYFEQKAERQKA